MYYVIMPKRLFILMTSIDVRNIQTCREFLEDFIWVKLTPESKISGGWQFCRGFFVHLKLLRRECKEDNLKMRESKVEIEVQDS